MRKINLGIIGSGNGTSLQPIIDAIEHQELAATIQVVLANKPEAGILDRARKHWIPGTYVAPTVGEAREVYDEKLFNALQQYPIDLVVLVGYMKVLSKAFVDSFPNAIINVHPSLLPKHAGLMNLAVHQAVLTAGETVSGCTVHLVNEFVDAGDIISQKTCPVLSTDRPEALKARVQLLEGTALIEAIQLIQVQGFHHE